MRDGCSLWHKHSPQSGSSRIDVKTKATFSAAQADSPLPFDLASRLFHRAFCTRHLFRLASFFLGLADLRRRGKVICCLSHEAGLSRGEKRGGMNTIAVANINFYFRARERISPAFKVIPILDDEKWRYFRRTADLVPRSVFHRKLFSLRCEFWERFMDDLENGRANFSQHTNVSNSFGVYDTSTSRA